ncbi:kinase-like domain-containing protein [Zopfochytrium polystomum]|nr:kinase-like domain-containing protein [Zopfochytrium polystomum]
MVARSAAPAGPISPPSSDTSADTQCSDTTDPAESRCDANENDSDSTVNGGADEEAEFLEDDDDGVDDCEDPDGCNAQHFSNYFAASSPAVVQSYSSAPLRPSPRALKATTTSPTLPHYDLLPEFYKQYQLKFPLGVGGSAFVFAAMRRSDRKVVAVKFLFKDRIPADGWKQDRGLRRMVPIEAFILRKMDHINIVKFYDIYEDSKFVYLVMDAVSPIEPQRRARPQSLTLTPPSPSKSPKHCRHVSLDTKPTPHDPNDLAAARLAHLSSLRSHLPLSATTGEPSSEPRRPRSFRSGTFASPTSATVQRRRPSHDLFDCIERNPQIPEPTVRHLFSQIAAAINHMHSRGFCHRDLKDENVIVDARLRVCLIDFGAARPVASGLVGVPAVAPMAGNSTAIAAAAASQPRKRVIRQFEEFAGTRAYISPEILRGEMYGGFEHDVWCLGVLLFVLLESYHPFPDTPQNLRTRRPALRSRRTAQCEDLLDRMLAPDPSYRASVDEVLRHEWMSMPLQGSIAVKVGVDGVFGW